MKLLEKIFCFSILMILFSCGVNTSTPKEFLNKNNVSEEDYLSDVKSLQKTTLQYTDSVGKQKTPKSKVTILDISIDTIFYNNDNKIVFLAIAKRVNPYVKLKAGNEYKDGIDYYGNCFIGKKDKSSSNIEIIHKLKYSVNSDESDGYLRVKKKLKKIYLCEMNEVKNKYNVNDTRFWTSNVWGQAEIMNAKMRRYLQKKKTNPEDVYPR